MFARLARAALAGAFFSVCFPPLDWTAVAVVALVPLLWELARCQRLLEGAAVGLVFGVVFGLLATFWLVPTLRHGFDMPLRHALPFAVAIVGYHAWPYALFGGLAVWLRRGRLPCVVSIPCAFVCVELLRNGLPNGVPWLLLGHAGHAWPTWLQWAAVGGVPALSFVLVFINACLVEAGRAANQRGPWAGARWVAVAAGVALAVSGAGAIALRAEAAAPSAHLRVGIVHAAIPQSERWQAATRRTNLERHLELTQRAAEGGAEVVVWSETSVEFVPGDLPELAAELAGALDGDAHRRVIAGAPIRLPGEEGPVVNAAWMVDGSGAERGLYAKQHLLPIAETDLARLLAVPGVRRVLRPFLSGPPYRAGDSVDPLDAGPQAVGVLVCFEAVYPEAARRRAEAGARWLLNSSNESHLASAVAVRQHLVISIFRAVETGRSLVRVANRGHSGWVSPAGRFHQTHAPGEAGSTVVRIPLYDGATPYARGGFAWPLCAAVLLLVAVLLPARKAPAPP
ncbi:MAG: apolipoprotein N-acyltransferase [Proteobacteria bacterium]|nr:apolipoprotein N-acyltransferase [Pseudomonadota bacterium]